jgi:quinolinate synthase
VWALENLVAGNEVNVIEVDPDTAHWAKVALQRMLDLPGRVTAPAHPTGPSTATRPARSGGRS